ncbi:MAG: hypothetical protein RL148_2703 [Planctomycetota bacterium]
MDPRWARGFLVSLLVAFGAMVLPAQAGTDPKGSEKPPAATPDTRVARAKDGSFPASVTLQGSSLQLNGAGLCEWGIFGIDLYHGALYVTRKPETASEALTADQAMAIHLDFCRELTAAQLREAYTASVKVNAGKDLAQYEQSLKALCDAMATVKEGDAYTFLLVPEQGTKVLRNGKEVASMPCEDFRKLFVRLYLGDKPPTAELRKAMLGAAR